jgi:hypothetical protein
VGVVLCHVYLCHGITTLKGSQKTLANRNYAPAVRMRRWSSLYGLLDLPWVKKSAHFSQGLTSFPHLASLATPFLPAQPTLNCAPCRVRDMGPLGEMEIEEGTPSKPGDQGNGGVPTSLRLFSPPFQMNCPISSALYTQCSNSHLWHMVSAPTVI